MEQRQPDENPEQGHEHEPEDQARVADHQGGDRHPAVLVIARLPHAVQADMGHDHADDRGERPDEKESEQGDEEGKERHHVAAGPVILSAIAFQCGPPAAACLAADHRAAPGAEKSFLVVLVAAGGAGLRA